MKKNEFEEIIDEMIEEAALELAYHWSHTEDDVWDHLYIDPDAPIEVGDVVAYIPGGICMDYNQPPEVETIEFYIVDRIDCDYIWFDNGIYATDLMCLRTDVLDEPKELFKVILDEES